MFHNPNLKLEIMLVESLFDILGMKLRKESEMVSLKDNRETSKSL
jgi:hypothetical protein